MNGLVGEPLGQKFAVNNAKKVRKQSKSKSGSHLVYKLKDSLKIHYDTTNSIPPGLLKPVTCSSFAPVKENVHTNKYIVASCGGNSVCFTDCANLHVFLKYIHVDEEFERFLTLSWTLVSYEAENVTNWIRVLSVAGDAKSIKLINVENQTCFKYLEGHSGAVNSLVFSKLNPFHLYSCSEDNIIRLWHIGSPLKNEGQQCLKVFNVAESTSPWISIALSPLEDNLLCSNSDCALQLFTSPESSSPKKRNKKLQDILYDGDGWFNSPADDLHFINNDIVLSKTCGNNAVADGIHIWKVSESNYDNPKILANLNWTGNLAYSYRGVVVQQNDRFLYCVGGMGGEVLMYDLGEITGDCSSSKPDPCIVLHHPSSMYAIKHVSVSEDMKYVVAANENDTIFLWELC